MRAGYPNGDPIAALFVAVLVLAGAARLIRANVDVLWTCLGRGGGVRARGDCRARAGGRAAPAADAAGRREPVRGRGHRRAALGRRRARAMRPRTRSRRPRTGPLPGSDVVVHVEPVRGGSARPRARGGARGARRTRDPQPPLVEIGGRNELSLHLKLPGDAARSSRRTRSPSRSSAAICAAAPEARRGADAPRAADRAVRRAARWRLTRARCGGGSSPRRDRRRARRELRFLRTDGGLVALLTLGTRPARHTC